MKKLFTIGFIWMILPGGYAAWVQKAPFGGTAKHRCTAFSVGNKGYIGLGHTNSGTLAYFKDFWEYDPGTNSWTQIADFGGGYRYHAVGFGIGNSGYVGLGEDDNGNYTTDFWRYIPLINTWVQVAGFPGDARRGSCSFVINGKGYVGTGQLASGYASDFYCYDPLNNSWDTLAPFPGEARSSAVAFAHNGIGYVGTGHVVGDATNDFYAYDPVADSWQQKADVGTTTRQDATGFVVLGEGYIGTGDDVLGSDNYNDFWKYNFQNDTWVQVADFDGQSRRYLVSFVIEDVAYCGTGTNGTNLRDFWAYYPLLEIEEAENERSLLVYPNPSVDGIFQIDVSSLAIGKSYQVLVFDSFGRSVLEEKFSTSLVQLDMTNLNSGTYYYLLYSGGEKLSAGKLIIV